MSIKTIRTGEYSCLLLLHEVSELPEITINSNAIARTDQVYQHDDTLRTRIFLVGGGVLEVIESQESIINAIENLEGGE